MDFTLSDEQKMIQRTIREFVNNELIPLEQDVLRNEREGRPSISEEVLESISKKAKDIGFWGLSTPEEYGGANLGPLMEAIVWMELGRTFVPFQFGGYADNILYECNPEQKEKYLIPTLNGDKKSCFAITEPEAGSDLSHLKTTAVKDGDHWVINGEKTFITGGNKADFAIVFAVTDPVRGTNGGVTAFLVDRDMGWRSEYIHTMGQSGPASLVFEDVRVPVENILGDEGQAFELAMKWIGNGRIIMPAHALGAAERLLQMAIEYANTRKTFGKPIAERQAIQWMIADSAVEIETAKWLILHAAWMDEQGKDSRHQSAMAKLHGSIIANKVVDRVLQIHGGMGYTRELPIERWYRELRVHRIWEGTDEIQRRTIARNLLKGYEKVGKLFD